MEESQSSTKLINVKKVTPSPVESTINQRPRRKIKHKFIKCNRDSPETSFITEALTECVEEVVVAATSELESSDASTAQATIPRTTNQQKSNSKKNVRLSGRQNQCKDSALDIDDSTLQMVEIIDDPSDDPNVSIEEIIETCVLDAEEYQRTVTGSKEVCNDSSSNTTTSVTEPDDGSLTSADKTNFNTQCIQNSCDKQISVGLVDCMKNKNIFKHLQLDEHNHDDKNSKNTFEGVFNKSSEDVIEKVDIKPTTEFLSPIRTRRVTRLSSMSARRPTDIKLSTPSPKNNAEAITEATKLTEFQNPIHLKTIDNQTKLEDAITQIETSCDTGFVKCENEVEIVASLADPRTIELGRSECVKDEQLNTTELHNDLIGFGATIKPENIENDATSEINEREIETEGILILEEQEISEPPGSPKIPQETNCNNRLINDEKTKEKIKLKKERKRTAEKHNIQGEEKSQSSTVPESQTTEQNRSEFITFMENKFQDSDLAKQMQRIVADDSEGSVRRQDSSSDVVKVEKNKKKKDCHADRDIKSKRTSDASKKSEKSFDSESSFKSSNSRSSSSCDKRGKDSKDCRPAELKVKQHPSEQDSQTRKSHKRDSISNRSEKEIAMDQLNQLRVNEKTVNRNKLTSHSLKESSERIRDSSVKTKTKSTPDTTKAKSKPKEIVQHDAKDDKSSSSKNVLDPSSNRKTQPQTTSANRPNSKNNRCGTDFILSECYLPKQVKYDESLYSIEALKAAQAAQEEQIKADAEAAKKAKEILAAKEEQAKAARAAARLARQEEAKAMEREKAEAEKVAKVEADKAIKLAKAAAKAARTKQIKESSSRSNGNLSIK